MRWGRDIPISWRQGNTVIANNPTLILNIIAVNETGTGYLLAHPDDTPAPATSNVNYYAGRTVSNLALVPTGTTSTINVTSHGATLNIIVDCFGYFAN